MASNLTDLNNVLQLESVESATKSTKASSGWEIELKNLAIKGLRRLNMKNAKYQYSMPTHDVMSLINGTLTNNKKNSINYLNDYFTNIGSNIMHKKSTR